MDQSNKFTTILLFALAFGIGVFHLFQGFMSIFVFKENEPILSWVCMLSGPVSTLPATITAIFNRKLGGYWLISGGVLSGILFIWWTSIVQSWFYILIVTAPMIFLGAAFLRLPKK
jgi:hypothetical protein